MIVERKSRKGRTFYGCANYPKCDFVSWDRVVPEPCPVCGDYVVVKMRRGGETRRTSATPTRRTTPRHRRCRRRARRRDSSPSDAHASRNGHRGRPRRVRGRVAACAARRARCGCTRCGRTRAARRTTPRCWPSWCAATRCAAPRSRTRVGLLKEELARLDSLIVDRGARERRSRPAARWPSTASASARSSSRGSRPAGASRSSATKSPAIPADGLAIVACGPLPSAPLAAQIDALVGGERLHYYDAAAPIVATDSIDHVGRPTASRVTTKATATTISTSRSTAQQYRQFVADLRALPQHDPKGFELDVATGKVPYFEGCLPIEEMAARGEDALRYGPLKPVGLRDPRTGKTPYAVVQLRNEDAAGDCAQPGRLPDAPDLAGAKRSLRAACPGSRSAEWLRLGRDAPQHVHRRAAAARSRACNLRARPGLFFAGQITGAEGYVEAAACGAIAGHRRARELHRRVAPVDVPADTALGAVVAHLQNAASPDFQPANVTWTWFSPLAGRTDPRQARAARRARGSRADASRHRGRTRSRDRVQPRAPARSSRDLNAHSFDHDRRGAARREDRDGRRRSSDARQDRHEARRAQGAPHRRRQPSSPASPAAPPTGSRCSRSSKRKLAASGNNLMRAAVELAKDWRQDRALRRLEALLLVGNPSICWSSAAPVT